jgi:hypothetical protein
MFEQDSQMNILRRWLFATSALAVLIGPCGHAWATAPSTIPDVIAASHLILLSTWSATDDVSLTCTVTHTTAHSGDAGNQLRIFNGDKEMFSFAPGLAPLSMFSTQAVGSRLVTVWVSGSGAYRVYIFAYRAGKVIQVLDVGSKAMPEFVYGALSRMDNSQRVIVSKGDWLTDDSAGVAYLQPTTADVYIWNGTSYDAKPNVPWAERLRK